MDRRLPCKAKLLTAMAYADKSACKAGQDLAQAKAQRQLHYHSLLHVAMQEKIDHLSIPFTLIGTPLSAIMVSLCDMA